MHYTVCRKTNDFVTLQSFFHCTEGGGNISLWGTKPSTLNYFHKVAKMKHQITVSKDEMICLHNKLQNLVLNEGSMIWDWPGG